MVLERKQQDSKMHFISKHLYNLPMQHAVQNCCDSLLLFTQPAYLLVGPKMEKRGENGFHKIGPKADSPQ